MVTGESPDIDPEVELQYAPTTPRGAEMAGVIRSKLAIEGEPLAELIVEHECSYEWGGPSWYCGAEGCSTSGDGWTEYAAHLAETLGLK